MAALGVKSLPCIGGQNACCRRFTPPGIFCPKNKNVFLKRKISSKCWLGAGYVKQGGLENPFGRGEHLQDYSKH